MLWVFMIMKIVTKFELFLRVLWKMGEFMIYVGIMFLIQVSYGFECLFMSINVWINFGNQFGHWAPPVSRSCVFFAHFCFELAFGVNMKVLDNWVSFPMALVWLENVLWILSYDKNTPSGSWRNFKENLA